MFCIVNKYLCFMFYMWFIIINNMFNKLLFLLNFYVFLVRYDFIGLNVLLCIIDFKDK